MITWFIGVKNRSSLLQLSGKHLFCICFVWCHKLFQFSPDAPVHIAMLFTSQILWSTLQLCFYRPIAQMEFVSSSTVVLIVGLYIDCDTVSTHCAGRVEVSHLTSLSVSLYGEPTKTRPPGSKPALQAQRLWRLVLDHLKRPVNKAESFRYKPSECEPLQWSTDSQKYHCWQWEQQKNQS